MIVLIIFAHLHPLGFDADFDFSDTLRSPSLTAEINFKKRSGLDPWFSQDKILHFYFSTSLTGLVYHLTADQGNREPGQSRIFAISITSLVSVGKEIFDRHQKKVFSWKDLAWDALGIAAGCLVFTAW